MRVAQDTIVVKECSQPTCFTGEMGCALGELDRSKCPHWQGGEVTNTPVLGADETIPFPWSGYALGLSDLSFIAGKAKPLIVAIAGPESAGKTTLLASWYLLAGRGKLLNKNVRFNGSCSLHGWEAIASSLRWTPGQPPTFPPHTTSRDARAPGLLHFSVRTGQLPSRDLLFADAPGAWFQKWAANLNASDAEGARWLDAHADVILLAADRQALSGPRLGPARNAFQLLAKRVAAQRRDRPVALVWTKGDVEVDPGMEQSIRDAVRNDIGDALEFTTSVHSKEGDDVGVGFKELFNWVLGVRRKGAIFKRDCDHMDDPLFLFGRR